MNIKNLILNKKKIGSIILAFNLLLCNKFGNAEIVSYGSKTTLKDGREVTLHFTTKENDNDVAFVTLDNIVGYVPINAVNYENLSRTSIYDEKNKILLANCDCYIYSEPRVNSNIISKLNINDEVKTLSKTNDGWYAIYTSTSAGFVHESFLKEKIEMKYKVVVTGNNVNIRSGAGTNYDIIGTASKNDFYDILDEYEIKGDE